MEWRPLCDRIVGVMKKLTETRPRVRELLREDRDPNIRKLVLVIATEVFNGIKTMAFVAFVRWGKLFWELVEETPPKSKKDAVELALKALKDLEIGDIGDIMERTVIKKVKNLEDTLTEEKLGEEFIPTDADKKKFGDYMRKLIEDQIKDLPPEYKAMVRREMRGL